MQVNLFLTPKMKGSLMWKTRKGIGYLESFLLTPLSLAGYFTTTVTQSSQFRTSSSSSLFPASRSASSSFPDLSRVRDVSHFERQLQGRQKYYKKITWWQKVLRCRFLSVSRKPTSAPSPVLIQKRQM